ncbi:hypothetical protein GQ42DRAFT_164534 [Ramicandelaber brevisporus]|nr:hypothetical protein GQ42DRAFT_164534 [Ramicandelaber brevisporus]
MIASRAADVLHKVAVTGLIGVSVYGIVVGSLILKDKVKYRQEQAIQLKREREAAATAQDNTNNSNNQ